MFFEYGGLVNVIGADGIGISARMVMNGVVSQDQSRRRCETRRQAHRMACRQHSFDPTLGIRCENQINSLHPALTDQFESIISIFARISFATIACRQGNIDHLARRYKMSLIRSPASRFLPQFLQKFRIGAPSIPSSSQGSIPWQWSL